MARLTNPFAWAAELFDHNYSFPQALRKVAEFWENGDLGSNSATDGQVLEADGSGGTTWVTKFSQVPLTTYDAEPARASETNLHGGLLSLSTASALDSGTPINITKGTGKIMLIVNAGSDLVGGLTITGSTVDRETGVVTGSDTDDIVVDALSVDATTTDGNGNLRHEFSDAYISSKWFTGAVQITTADLTLTDVDVYHVSFEQFNDNPSYTLQTFDMNVLTTNANAEIDAYLYALVVTGSKCAITREASLNVGTDGETAIANQYWRLRRGNIAKAMNGSSDGIWIDVFYSNSPSYVEDATIKVWADMPV